MSPLAACSIASNNYLALARVFAESYREHHPGATVYVCIADQRDPRVRYEKFPFVTIFAEELEIPAFFNFAFRYDLLELNTAIKPFFLSHLRDRYGLDRVLYFDPDVLVLDSLPGLEEALASHEAALTPHITAPLDDGFRPAERAILMAGVFNLGFLGLRLDEQTAPFLEWWKSRLYLHCRNDIHFGLFVDQAWMDLAPAFLDRVAVLRDPIYNVAYWNLPHRHPRAERGVWRTGGRPIGFFHFSGLSFDDLDGVSRHQSRLARHEVRELRPLLEAYRQRVYAAGHQDLSQIPYGFGTFRGTNIPVPVLARRALQRSDPYGRRWPDPFEPYVGDSFFSWLVEPLVFPGGTLNHVQLALWEERPDLINAFPEVFGRDLGAYVSWLLDCGEGRRAGLEEPFLAAARVKAPSSEEPPALFDLRFRPLRTTVIEPALRLLATLNLGQPGAATAWLNEPVPGVAARRPLLTRLALTLYYARTDVQRAYPEPLGRDQVAFACWFCLHGALEARLHPELVRPVARTLPPLRRILLAARRRGFLLSRPQPGPAWTLGVKEVDPELAGGRIAIAAATAITDSARPAGAESALPLPGALSSASSDQGLDRGVNVAGYFGMETGVGQVARGSLAALEWAGFSVATVPLDEVAARQECAERVHLPQGAPFPVTLLHANASETALALSILPAAAAAASYKIGYWFWELSHLPIGLAEHYLYLDELWAPSQFCRHAFEGLADLPVHWMPPCVPPPTVPQVDRSRLGLEEERFYFFYSFHVGSVPERKNPEGALELLRRLRRLGEEGVGLVLKVTGSWQAPDVVRKLRRACEGLPVVLLSDPVSRGEVEQLLSACDAVLSLHRSEGLGLLPIEALYLGKPVVATAYGGVTDYLDPTTGYPVAYRLRRLGESFGPYPRGAVWAEPDLDDAVEQALRLLQRPEEGAARAAVGRSRVEKLYGVEAAALRFTGALDRILNELPARRGGGQTHLPLAARGVLRSPGRDEA